MPNRTTTGDIESMAMYAGQGVGLIKEILPAGEVVRRLVREAQLLIQQKFQESWFQNPNVDAFIDDGFERALTIHKAEV